MTSVNVHARLHPGMSIVPAIQQRYSKPYYPAQTTA
jgi:hypothetical protein